MKPVNVLETEVSPPPVGHLEFYLHSSIHSLIPSLRAKDKSRHLMKGSQQRLVVWTRKPSRWRPTYHYKRPKAGDQKKQVEETSN
eukprot:4770639-Amphidinium_carterae.1